MLEIKMLFVAALITVLLMEPMASFLHRYLWHGILWSIHQSHHKKREGLFEWNDGFALVYALLSRGCIFGSSLDFVQGIGWGIVTFGVAYMIVHDGYIHNRFSCGLLGRFRYFRKLKAKHILHHSRTHHHPFGLFWV